MQKSNFRKGVNTLKRKGMSHKDAVRKQRYYAAKKNNPLIELSPKAAFYLLFVILFAVIGANKESAIATKLFAGAIAGMLLSEATGSLVINFGGEKLKKYSYPIPIWKFKFSISAFAIVTALVEIWLFT